jgi:carbon-monoxide dehydrogenase medium subunit
MHDFDYHAPATLAEALNLARSVEGGARFLAGGTDLLLAMEHARGGEGPHRVIDLKRVPGLEGITSQPDGALRIGALTTMAAIAAHPGIGQRFPALAEGAHYVGGPAIRNRATLGGNICNASPAADTSPALLAFGATVEVAGPKGTRSLPLAKLWIAPRRIALEPGEAVTAVTLAAQGPHSGNAFRRLTRTAMDIALVNAAAAVRLDAQGKIAEAVLALGAVGPTVVTVPEVRKALVGRAPDATAWGDARRLAEAAAKPIDDVRASADYRREMAGVLAARALEAAAAMAATGDAR